MMKTEQKKIDICVETIQSAEAAIDELDLILSELATDPEAARAIQDEEDWLRN